MAIVCRNCQSHLGSDRFCERCGAQEMFPAGGDIDTGRLRGLYRTLQEVRSTGPTPPEGPEDEQRFIRMMMGAIRGSEQDFVAAMGIKFLGSAIPEDRHPMSGVIRRLTAGETVPPEEMEAAMSRFAALRATLPAERQFTQPLADLDEIRRRLTGLRIALNPVVQQLREPSQREFVRTQQLGLDRRIAAVSVEAEMIRRGLEASEAGMATESGEPNEGGGVGEAPA